MKPIPSAPGYLAGEDGVIYSTLRGDTRPLKGSPTRDGYLAVSIAGGKRGAHSSRSIHLLVLEAWHGARPEGMFASHLDGNILNNRPDNLAWESQSENILRKHAHGTMRTGTSHPRSITSKQIERAKEMLNQGIPQTHIAETVGVSQSTVSNIKRGARHG